MITLDAALAWMRKVCLSFPASSEGTHFGEAVFKVRGKLFASCGEQDGAGRIVVQLEPDHARALLAADPRFEKYTRQRDCVAIELGNINEWAEIRELVEESYQLNAAAKKPVPAKKAATAKKPVPAKKLVPAKKAATAKKSAARS